MEAQPTARVVLHLGDGVREAEAAASAYPDREFHLIRGNNDWSSWASRLPRQLTFTLDGVKCTMAHKREDVSWDLQGVQLVVFGHSHQYFEEQIHGRLWLNPGSCGWPRFRRELTMAVLTLDGRQIQVQRVDIKP